MPEFIMNGKDAPEFQSLDAFTRGHIEAMLFTEEESLAYPDSGPGIGRTPSFNDIAPDALQKIIDDCAAFQRANAGLILAATSESAPNGYDYERAGNDFWYTRNGHGVGFWDRGLGDIGDKLTAACGYGTAFPPVDVYVSDDGKIYI